MQYNIQTFDLIWREEYQQNMTLRFQSETLWGALGAL